MVKRILTTSALVLSVLAITACAPPQVAVHNGGISLIDTDIKQSYRVLGYVSDKFCVNDMIKRVQNTKELKIVGYREALLAKAKKVNSNAEDVIRLIIHPISVYEVEHNWYDKDLEGCKDIDIVEATVVQYK